MPAAKKLETINQDDLPVLHHYPVPGCEATGLRGATYAHHGDYSLWLCRAELDADGRRYDDFVWTYRAPLPESQKVAGLACFYNEKVDLYVDGVLQEQPRTKWTEEARGQ